MQHFALMPDDRQVMLHEGDAVAFVVENRGPTPMVIVTWDEHRSAPRREQVEGRTSHRCTGVRVIAELPMGAQYPAKGAYAPA